MESGTAAQSGEKALGGGVRDSCSAPLYVFLGTISGSGAGGKSKLLFIPFGKCPPCHGNNVVAADALVPWEGRR